MNLSDLVTLMGVGVLVKLAPGADVAFAMSCGLAGGTKKGAVAGLGVGLGVFFHIVLAALGVSAIVATFDGGLQTLRLIGAAYLLYLAIRSWVATPITETYAIKAPVLTIGQAFLRGALVNVLNPKPILFILAFLPQFIDPTAGPAAFQILYLGVIFATTGALITAAYGAFAGRVARRLTPRLGLIHKATAVLLFGLAFQLVFL